MTIIEIKPHRWGWKVFEVPGVEPVFPEKRQAGAWQPSQRIGVNSVLLHRGHLPAVSKETGLVKRFT